MLEEFKNAALFSVRPTIHTNPSQKWSFLEMVFTPVEFETARFWFVWAEIILKTELFEPDDIMIIVWIPWLCSPQKQIQLDQ